MASDNGKDKSLETLDLGRRLLHPRRKGRDQLQDLFRPLLHELMTANTRVHEFTL